MTTSTEAIGVRTPKDSGSASNMLLDRTRFGIEDAQRAADDWGFNCGPAALCAITGKTPEEIRPHLRDFESKGYVSPSMMSAILKGLDVRLIRTFEEKAGVLRDELQMPRHPVFGLVRVQWDGTWCNEGVPIPARYRRSHWIAFAGGGRPDDEWCFDVNAMCVGGWIDHRDWSCRLVPWLIRECVPGGSGKWWPTHCWDVSV